MMCYKKHIKAILQVVPQPSITKINMKITTYDIANPIKVALAIQPEKKKI